MESVSILGKKMNGLADKTLGQIVEEYVNLKNTPCSCMLGKRTAGQLKNVSDIIENMFSLLNDLRERVSAINVSVQTDRDCQEECANSDAIIHEPTAEEIGSINSTAKSSTVNSLSEPLVRQPCGPMRKILDSDIPAVLANKINAVIDNASAHSCVSELLYGNSDLNNILDPKFSQVAEEYVDPLMDEIWGFATPSSPLPPSSSLKQHDSWSYNTTAISALAEESTVCIPPQSPPNNSAVIYERADVSSVPKEGSSPQRASKRSRKPTIRVIDGAKVQSFRKPPEESRKRWCQVTVSKPVARAIQDSSTDCVCLGSVNAAEESGESPHLQADKAKVPKISMEVKQVDGGSQGMLNVVHFTETNGPISTTSVLNDNGTPIESDILSLYEDFYEKQQKAAEANCHEAVSDSENKQDSAPQPRTLNQNKVLDGERDGPKVRTPLANGTYEEVESRKENASSPTLTESLPISSVSRVAQKRRDILGKLHKFS